MTQRLDRGLTPQRQTKDGAFGPASRLGWAGLIGGLVLIGAFAGNHSRDGGATALGETASPAAWVSDTGGNTVGGVGDPTTEPGQPLDVLTDVQEPVADEGATRGPDTQAETVPRLSDQQAVAAWKLPPGFRMNLFAGHPQVAQPIAGTFDRRGRMWLAENYTYAELPQRFDRDLRDRVVILSDADGDGVAESPQVFYDQAQLLASVEVGLGGVWLLAAPQLLFIPDADLDGRPDGPPQVILDGFEDQEVGHNLVNGLRWGPDGWLYGRHGIQATSHVGPPGTPESKRIALNCCIWRYHPTRQKFEVVTAGTTNPWGHDWDAHGELFFINTVIGHLWHAIPGLHTERMYGEDLRPYLFHLTSQVADHYHWDRRVEAWTQQRDGMSATTDAAGGGHAHSGLAIYHGWRWPSDYQGDVYALNFHGRRVNQDRLQTLGATFTATHKPDPFLTADPWFRGIDLFCGPDDAMYILDWSDLGECHENDGIHRSSGRVYRLDYVAGDDADRATPVHATGNVAAAPWTVAEVVTRLEGQDLHAVAELLVDPRPWVWRQARLRLQEQAAGFGRRDERLSEDLKAVAMDLSRRFQEAEDSAVRHRLLMGWWATGQLDGSRLESLLGHADPHVRVWAIRLLTDLDAVGGAAALDGLSLGQLSHATAVSLQQRAEVESDGLVLTYLASSLRLMSAADRWSLARRLARQDSFADDRIFPYLVWYGLEPSVPEMAGEVEQWLQDSQLPVVDRFVARRLAIEQTVRSGAVEPLLVALAQPTLSAARRANLLQGLAEGWNGWSELPTPIAWGQVAAAVAAEVEARGWMEQAAASFAAHQSWSERLAVLRDEQRPLELRQATLRSIVRQLNRTDAEGPDPAVAERSAEVEQEQRAREEVASALRALLQHRFLSVAAANAMAEWREPQATAWLIEGYGAAPPAGQAAIVSALTQRASSAVALLGGVAAGQIPRDAVTAGHLRQLQLLGDAAVATQLQALWPERGGLLGESQLQKIQALQEELQPESIARGDLMRGRHLYAQQCGKCHRLFGEGERLGPELTGAQRDNLNYWLQNIVAPSAEVSSEFRLTAVLLTDGRSLAGVVTQRTPASFVLVSQEQSQLVQMEAVEELRPLEQSLMPDGLLDNLSQQDKIDLFAYLMSARGE